MREPPPVPRADAREAAPRGPGAAPSGEQPGTSELQQRERRYRAIVDHAPIGIVTIDAGGEIISANRAFCDMVGYSTEELRAIPFSRLVPPADLDQAGERWVRLQKLISGEIDEFNSEARYVHKNGNTIWTCISLSAVRDDDGQFLHTVSMIEDITGQKTLEQRQQLLLDASAALSSSLDFETTLQQVARLSVHALADLCVVSLIDDAGAVRRVAAAHADPAQQALADTLQDDSTLIGDEPVGVAVALRTAATQLYEDFSSVFLDDAQTTGGLSVFKALNIRSMLIVPLIAKGTTIGAITFAYTGPARGYSTADTGIAEDLARRAAVAIDNARLHKMARDAETRFRGLVENLPAMVFVTSPDDQSTLLYQSPQIARLIGYQQDEWLADPRLWTKRLHPSDRARVLAAVEAAARSGEPLTLEYRFVRRDGSVVWMRDETALVRDDAGAELYWLGVTVDTTREKQAEERLRSSERRFRSLIQNAADITGILNVAGVIQFQSPAVEHTLGYRPGEMLDSHYSAYVHPDDAVAISRFVTEVIGQRGRHLPLTFRCRHGDGSWRWLEATITNFLGDPSIRGIVINARDITERMLAEQATRESQARFRSAFHDAAVGMAIIALDGRLIQVNPALCVMTEYSEAELLALADADISHPDDVSAGHELAGQFARGNIDTVQIEKRYLTRSGLSVWCVVNIAAVRDEQGAPLYLLAQAQDISERKELEAQLSHQALHDSLTGLPNRTLLLDRIDRELSLTRRHGGWVAVLFLDLDNFKVINDSLGHAAGDTVLVAVAQRLRLCVREEDTVARFGGDEFVIILGRIAGVEHAIDVTTRIISAMEQPFTVSGRSIIITPSIGIAVGEAGQQHRNDLLRHADIAMYRAKASGRARYNLFDAAMHDSALQRLELEHDLRQALERDEFFLVYQPVISIPTGKVLGLEAMARWRHPERGVILPAEFIPTAEETGLIVPIGEWVLREACRQAVEWSKCYRHMQRLRIGVNLSARQFQLRDLIRLVEAALIDSDLAPELLVLELTESVLMEHAGEAIVRLRELTALGVQIAIDDFGTGYSSLAYLQQFPVSVLKIDQSFVERIGQEQDGTPIVAATIGLAQTLGLTIVAEGIETSEQLRVLRGLGCDHGQGNYFIHPLPAGEVAEWLAGNAGTRH